uniref:Ig-like domain-containing protein n=1 Tax=Catagonus wagneri TaxID=51154 RepID=A0A8C3W5A6_9CETA
VSEAKPSIFPLSLGGDCSPSEFVVIACLVRDFFPSEPLKVTWSHSGEGVVVTNFPPAQAGGLYTMSSQLTLPVAQCPASQVLKCHVQHLSNPVQTVDVPCKGQKDPWSHPALVPEPILGALCPGKGVPPGRARGERGAGVEAGAGGQRGSLTCSDFSLCFRSYYVCSVRVLPAQPVPAPASPRGPAPGLQRQPHLHAERPEKT